jgi:hypothetical protein
MIDWEELFKSAVAGAVAGPAAIWIYSKVSGRPFHPSDYMQYAAFGAVVVPIGQVVLPRLQQQVRRIR